MCVRGVCVRGVEGLHVIYCESVRGVCVRGVCVRGVEGLHVIYCECERCVCEGSGGVTFNLL